MKKFFNHIVLHASLLSALTMIASADGKNRNNNEDSWSFVGAADVHCATVKKRSESGCNFDIEKNTLSIEKIGDSDALYEVEMQKTYLKVLDGVPVPAYCVFGGVAKRMGSTFVVVQNNDQDGAAVSGLKINMSRKKVWVVDENPSGNSRYCGDSDSFGGMTFPLR